MAKLKVIGSGDAFGTGGKGQSCFWIEWDNHQFLVDCGASSLSSIKKMGLQIKDLEFIAISHLHGDHVGGIPYILTELAYVHKANKKLKIIGPEGITELAFKLQELLYPGSIEWVENVVEFVEYGSETEINSFQLRNKTVKHSEPSKPNGIRIEKNGKVFTFSGDTEWTETLIDLSDNADLFICECYNYESDTPGHMNYKVLSANLDKLNYQRIYLTHPGQEIIDRLDMLEVPFLEDGQILDF